MTSEERRDQSNGVWLCQTHAKLIDSDAEHFTAERIRQWKRDAEQNAFRNLVAPEHQIAGAATLSATIPADEPEGLIRSLIEAGHRDLAAFKRTTLWPRYAIPLNLRITAPSSTMPFDAAGLATAIETFNEIVVVAPPAMGKTVTLLQTVEALLGRGGLFAVYIPLGQWSAAPDTLFGSILRPMHSPRHRKPN